MSHGREGDSDEQEPGGARVLAPEVAPGDDGGERWAGPCERCRARTRAALATTQSTRRSKAASRRRLRGGRRGRR